MTVGIQLVNAADVWAFPQLGRDQAAKLALVTMARIAKDRDEAPWYGLGWQPIARSLGYEGPHAQQQVSKVLRTLVEAKLIERTYEAPDGRRLTRSHNACWLIRIRPT